MCSLISRTQPEKARPIDTATLRAVWIIGPDRKPKLFLTDAMNAGRCQAAVLRALDARDTANGKVLACLATLAPGGDVMIPLLVAARAALATDGDDKTVLPDPGMARVQG